MEPAVRFFLEGCVIGLAIAAPVGPIGVLCIRRTFAHGWRIGFVTGLGAATADAVYGAIAAFGLTAISAFLLGHQAWLQLGGGLFLCALGVRTFRAVPRAVVTAPDRSALAGAYASTVVLTLANPATILSFVAVFAGAGLAREGRDAAEAASLVAGVFVGSAVWWLGLSALVQRWRRRYPTLARVAPNAVAGALVTGVALGAGERALRRVNRVSGSVLLLFGAAAVLAALRAYA